jgi:hypothetical protein
VKLIEPLLLTVFDLIFNLFKNGLLMFKTEDYFSITKEMLLALKQEKSIVEVILLAS